MLWKWLAAVCANLILMKDEPIQSRWCKHLQPFAVLLFLDTIGNRKKLSRNICILKLYYLKDHLTVSGHLNPPWFRFCSVLFSRSVVSDSLQPHGLQHARLLCPSPTPRVYSNSCPSSRWCHPTISSSVIPFSCLEVNAIPQNFVNLYTQWTWADGKNRYLVHLQTGL